MNNADMVDTQDHALLVQEDFSPSPLSPREREVLQLLSSGKSRKEIALDLNVSVKTIESHVKKVTRKLGIHSIAQLTKYAIREGLTSLDS
jgi:DNA-binding NarL/FixJ family response regulator